jgi:biotin operon repressor
MVRTATEWRILRALERGARSQSELEAEVGSARNTIRTALKALREVGLIQFVTTSEDGRVGTGRPKGMYYLRGDDAATPVLPLGTLMPGRLWVRARGAVDALDRAYELLAASDLLMPAAWAAELDGESRELLVIFDARFGAEPADALRRALQTIEGVEATTGSVRDVLAADDLEARATRLATISRMGDPGLEPGTSSLSEKRSNRLS